MRSREYRGEVRFGIVPPREYCSELAGGQDPMLAMDREALAWFNDLIEDRCQACGRFTSCT